MRKLILYIAVTIFLTSGIWSCAPKMIVRENVVTKVDSTLVISLKNELNQKSVEIEILRAELTQTRKENTVLKSEINAHIINYDTSKEPNADGKHPIQSETIINSKSTLEKHLDELSVTNAELRKENTTLTNRVSNLEYQLEQKRDTESKIDTKPERKSYAWVSVIINVILLIIIILGGVLYVRRGRVNK